MSLNTYPVFYDATTKEIVYSDGMAGVGIQGLQGPTGDTGYTGSQGYAGTQGYAGSQGYFGYQGYHGAQGFVGATGATGPGLVFTALQGEVLYYDSELGLVGTEQLKIVDATTTQVGATGGTLNLLGSVFAPELRGVTGLFADYINGV